MRLLPIFSLLLPGIALSQQAWTPLKYSPSPVDNPLRGMVPYITADSWQRFPHSMQFQYYSLRDLMTGPDSYDWSKLEASLQTAQERGCQFTFRVMLEYPGNPNCMPQFLLDDGLQITEWETGEEADGIRYTPDYKNPALREALKNFITAMGEKYDGDPRIGYITAGLLGLWGEWHNYPKTELWAPKELQKTVLDTYETAFTKTPILLRYPAGSDHPLHIKNASRNFGYHDDSFDFQTINTKERKHWHFMSLMEAAGTTEKWKQFPIAGELRPELWETSFTDTPHPEAQGFVECVQQTHVTWLLDSGLFAKQFPLPEDRRQRAIKEIGTMGYEFTVEKWRKTGNEIEIIVKNRGVAPFYHDWKAELFAGEKPIAKFPIKGILPGESVVWKTAAEGDSFKLRVKNPMPGGKPVRFANAEQQGEWLPLP